MPERDIIIEECVGTNAKGEKQWVVLDEAGPMLYDAAEKIADLLGYPEKHEAFRQSGCFGGSYWKWLRSSESGDEHE